MRRSLMHNLLPQSNSQSTLELRHFIENGACLFDTDRPYPIWDEGHRAELEQKILDHYWLRQIGFETFGRFKFHVNTRMREIMPKYVKLYDTTKFVYNPIENYNMTEGSDQENASTTKNLSDRLEKVSDTPQTSVSNLDKYMTAATQENAEATSEDKSSSKHTAWRKGNIGVMSTQNLIQQERDLIIDLDRMIIGELKDLFLGVY